MIILPNHLGQCMHGIDPYDDRHILLLDDVTQWLEERKIEYVLYSTIEYGTTQWRSDKYWFRADLTIDFTSPEDEMLFKLTWL
jgi:hypothetical protein